MSRERRGTSRERIEGRQERFDLGRESRERDAEASVATRRRSPKGAAPALRGRAGAGLASARDRQRLRERRAAERARVERMLARVPDEGSPLRSGRSRGASRRPAGRIAIQEWGTAPAMARLDPSCPVCGSAKLASDEVQHAGTLRLTECLHCEHRWTERPTRRWVELGAAMGRSADGVAAVWAVR